MHYLLIQWSQEAVISSSLVLLQIRIIMFFLFFLKLGSEASHDANVSGLKVSPVLYAYYIICSSWSSFKLISSKSIYKKSAVHLRQPDTAVIFTWYNCLSSVKCLQQPFHVFISRINFSHEVCLVNNTPLDAWCLSNVLTMSSTAPQTF